MAETMVKFMIDMGPFITNLAVLFLAWTVFCLQKQVLKNGKEYLKIFDLLREADVIQAEQVEMLNKRIQRLEGVRLVYERPRVN